MLGTNVVLKSVDIKQSVATIKVEFNSKSHSYAEEDILALCVLLGGYNQFARNVSPEKYKELKLAFNVVVANMKYAMTKDK